MTRRWTLAWRSCVKLTNRRPWQARSRRGTLWASSIVTIVAASWMTLSMNQKDLPLRNLYAEWESSRSTEEICNNAPVKTVCPGCGKSSNFIADAAESVMPSVVNLRLESQYVTDNGHKLYSSGSGVVIDTEGTILTNAHVVTDISDNGTILIHTHDDEEFEGYIHAMDTLSDLAIIKLKPVDSNGCTQPRKLWEKANLGSNRNLRPGDWVLAVGSPLGLQHTVTVGVVSSRSRKSHELGGIESPVEFIQTDCTIHTGSSGGPLVNIDGEVIGVITTRTEKNEGISFAIRIDNALEIIQQMLKKGRVSRPWLGLKMMSLSTSLIEQLKSSRELPLPPGSKGVFVSDVVKGSPACSAGILPGDVIVAIDSKDIQHTQELLKILGLRVGEEIRLTILRTVALEQDWDGRIMRYDIERKELVVTPSDLGAFLSASST